ncbi:MAG: alkaline phosphatase family protein [Thermodesulfobacteriota bacterium]|nr:alkaline phosphatase family protein [Thermodesulfobacteriota bacterium]
MKRVIFLLLDGSRVEAINKYLDLGYLPNLKNLIENKGSNQSAITVFPSTTGPAYVPFLMGLYPGNANLPGIRWFDKYKYSKSKWNRDGHRSYVGIESIFLNSDIKKSKKTIFEYIPQSRSIFNEITKGINPKFNMTKLAKIYYKMKSHFFGSNDIDSLAMRKLLEAIDTDAEFIFCCLHGVDSNSHIYGCNHNAVIDSYKEFDLNLGLVINKIKKRNEMKDTLLIITSDHGHSDTAIHIDLVEFLQSRGHKVLSYPMIFNKYLSDIDCSVMVSGNSMAHIYLRSESNWKNKTHFPESDKLINDLLKTDGIDLVLTLNEKQQIQVRSKKGFALIEEKENLIYYKPLKDDPFNYKEMNEMLSFEEILRETQNSDYPDAITQIVQLFKSPRCGDIVISAETGYDLRKDYEYPEHKSSHGSLKREHMVVPLIVNKKINDKNIRTVDLFPTILNYLGKDLIDGIDGKNLNID